MKIRVYTAKMCPNCKILKEFLAAEGVAYEEVDMTTVDALTELRMQGIFTFVAPILQAGSTFLTAKELFRSDGDGELQKDKVEELINRIE